MAVLLAKTSEQVQVKAHSKIPGSICKNKKKLININYHYELIKIKKLVRIRILEYSCHFSSHFGPGGLQIFVISIPQIQNFFFIYFWFKKNFEAGQVPQK